MSTTKRTLEHHDAIFIADYVQVRDDYEGVVVGIESTLDEVLVNEYDDGAPTNNIHEESINDIQQHDNGRCID